MCAHISLTGHGRNEFYFEFGMEYVKLLKDIDLGKVLLDAFGARYVAPRDVTYTLRLSSVRAIQLH